MTGVAAVQGRIAELQLRFASLTPVQRPAAAAPATGPTASSAAAEPSPSFAAELLARLSASSAAPTRPATAPAAGGAADGERIVASAKQYLGVPYLWGGTDPSVGLDCSGFVQLVYREAGIELPRVSRDQARAGRPVASLAEARPGDLVAFGSPVDHIGIYAGDGKMVVAPRRGDVVKVQDVYRTPSAIRRVLPDAPAGPAAPPAVRPPALSSGPAAFAALFAQAGAQHGVSPALLTAVARAESAFDPRAVSPAGAQGLMQFMPGTARELGVDPFDPASAVDGAARLLRSHLDRFGSVELALAAYNAGPGAVARYGGVPPFTETQRYVQKILAEVGGSA